MGDFVRYNPNPCKRQVGDCTVRALTRALKKSWEEIYINLCLEGFILGDMPSSNAVWGSFLRTKGFRRHILPDTCPDGYTVNDFIEEHPTGTYILALSGHVVCIEEGKIFDSWDSRDEIPLYFWVKEE